MIWSDFAAFTMTHLMLLIALAAVILVAGFKANRRLAKQRGRFYAVVVTNIIAFITISLWLLQFEVAHHVSERVEVNSDVWSMEMRDPASELLRQPALTQLDITGFGFYQSQLVPFKQIKVNFTPDKLAAGLIDVRWPQQLLLGEQGQFNAIWHDSDKPNDIVLVELFDMAGELKAATRVKHQETVNLALEPKLSGKIHYQVRVTNSKQQVLFEQKLMVAVNAGGVLNMLVVQGAPSFETKHLQRWASSQGAQMLLMTQISQARYLTQAVNRETPVSHELSPELLRQADVLIIDGRSLSQMPAEHLTWIIGAIEQGLGVLVLADNALLTNKQIQQTLLPDMLLSSAEAAMIAQSLLPVINGQLSEVAFERANIVIEPSTRAFIIHRDHKDLVLSAGQELGLGRVVVTSFNQSYQWRLHGQIDLFAKWWRAQLNWLARFDSEPRFILDVKEQAPFNVLQRQRFCVFAKDEEVVLQQVVADQVINLLLTPLGENRFCTKLWPNQAGWQQLLLIDSTDQVLDSLWHYSYEPDGWLRQQQHRRLKQTLDFVDTQQQRVNEGQLSLTTSVTIKQPVQDWIYWLLLIICGSFLWWDNRTNDRLSTALIDES